MIKTLRPIGNSLGIIIDRPILELLGIDRQTRLRITTDGNGLYIVPLGPDETAQADSSTWQTTPSPEGIAEPPDIKPNQ